MPTESDPLLPLAKAAAAKAYCPYSCFRVGAAVLAKSGAVFVGCNVENASYGLTVCAERVAVLHMVASGALAFDRLVLYTPTPEPTAPCGACRQVLFEFGPDAEVVGYCDGPGVRQWTVRELLPDAFGPADLS